MAHRASRSERRGRVGVLVIDDSPVFLEAVRQVIASVPELELVGEAISGEEGVALATRVQPDLVLVDVALPGIDGLETCRRLRSCQPAPLIVLCSVEDDPRDPSPDLPCASAAFLSKGSLTGSALLTVWRAQPDANSRVSVAPARGD